MSINASYPSWKEKQAYFILPDAFALSRNSRIPMSRTFFPASLVERVDEIEVDVVGLEVGKLLLKESVHVLGGMYVPCGDFCREVDLFSVAVSERVCHSHLVLSVGVDIRGVDVVHSVVNGVSYNGG